MLSEKIILLIIVVTIAIIQFIIAMIQIRRTKKLNQLRIEKEKELQITIFKNGFLLGQNKLLEAMQCGNVTHKTMMLQLDSCVEDFKEKYQNK